MRIVELYRMTKRKRSEELIAAVSRRLREVREASGISQEKVLFQTGVYLTRIENGHRNITVSTLVTLCSTYGITLQEFFNTFDDHDQVQPE